MDESRSMVLLFRNNRRGSAGTPGQVPRLAAAFLRLPALADLRPKIIWCRADSVRLVCQGSLIPDELRDLDAPGMGLGLRSACLEIFWLRQEEGRGIVGAMGKLLTALWERAK